MTHELKTLIPIRQSFIEDLRLCPERARQKIIRDERMINDATLAGSAVHFAVERVLRGGVRGIANLNEDAMTYWRDNFNDEVMMHKFKTEQGSLQRMLRCVEAVYEVLELWRFFDGCDIQIEQQFEFTEAGYLFQGTTDLIVNDGEVIIVFDWKTGRLDGNKGWLLKRYSSQPTIYCHAVSADLFIFVYSEGKAKDNSVQTVEASRSPEYFNALVAELDSWLPATDSFNLEAQWPMRANDWWCSPKWCPHFKECPASVLEWTEET